MKTPNSSSRLYLLVVGLLIIYSAAFAGKETRLTCYDAFGTAGEQVV